jgi:hypothetical protein
MFGREMPLKKIMKKVDIWTCYVGPIYGNICGVNTRERLPSRDYKNKLKKG